MQIITKQIGNRNITFTSNESAASTVTTGIIRGVKHNFIIDTGTGGDCAQAMLDYLAAEGDALPIIVINTHSHWDHVYGNWKFEGKALQIIAHKLCLELMNSRDWDFDVAELAKRGSIMLGEVHKHLPNVLIDAPLHFPDDGVLIFPNPGHSPDSISILDEVDKVLYVGDNWGIDEDGLSYWGYDESHAEDATEDEVDALYDASFFAMMEFLREYDFETAVLSHGGDVPWADFVTLEKEWE